MYVEKAIVVSITMCSLLPKSHHSFWQVWPSNSLLQLYCQKKGPQSNRAKKVSKLFNLWGSFDTQQIDWLGAPNLGFQEKILHRKEKEKQSVLSIYGAELIAISMKDHPSFIKRPIKFIVIYQLLGCLFFFYSARVSLRVHSRSPTSWARILSFASQVICSTSKFTLW